MGFEFQVIYSEMEFKNPDFSDSYNSQFWLYIRIIWRIFLKTSDDEGPPLEILLN